MRLTLDQKDTAKIRKAGGIGYVAVLEVRGPRGARYRPVRSAVCVTEEAAAEALTRLERRFIHSRQLPLRREVVPVEAKLSQEV